MASVPPPLWLLRISEAFRDFQRDLLAEMDAVAVRKLGREFVLVRSRSPELIRNSGAAGFIRWNLPVHHAWPCCPKETDGFIEKAAQALARKFAGRMPQTVLVGTLDPGASNRYYRTLASNLRGRALQLFPGPLREIRQAEEQDPIRDTLFCIVGREGLFCGLQSPKASGGFHPGGTKFISQGDPSTISRAGAKIAEALYHLELHRRLPDAGGHWLELGASPGGMTAELLSRGYKVTAVDRAPLDGRLANAAGLVSVTADAEVYHPERGATFDALLSDMNGDAQRSMEIVTRFAPLLVEGGLAVFTLKLAGIHGFAEARALEAAVRENASVAGLCLLDRRHLSYNRHELTLFFERNGTTSRA